MVAGEQQGTLLKEHFGSVDDDAAAEYRPGEADDDFEDGVEQDSVLSDNQRNILKMRPK